jgi:hypothetical protein
MGEEIQLTYQAVGRGLVATPTVNFPSEITFPVQEKPAQDIHFSPTFSPIFQPNLPNLSPEIKITVEPTPLHINVPDQPIHITVPTPLVTVNYSFPVSWKGAVLILFANSLFFAIVLFAIIILFMDFNGFRHR